MNDNKDNSPNWMEDKLNEFYNGAVDNCIVIVQRYFDDSETYPYDLIEQLKKLQK